MRARFKSRARLEAENVVLRQQVIVLSSKVRTRVRLRNIDRLYRIFSSVLDAVCGEMLISGRHQQFATHRSIQSFEFWIRTAVNFATWAVVSIGREMVTVGLMAMHDGNSEFALRCYRESIRYSPLRSRLIYGTDAQASRISPLPMPRLRRLQSGPPFATLQDRPAMKRNP